MSFTARLPAHLRPRREKVFGQGRPRGLDRNAKVRIMTYARALMRRTEKGKAYGPITAKALAVLEALLWGFHNARSGLCFPSLAKIAEKARCAPSTVAEAIKALEAADILTWVNRFDKIRSECRDFLGRAFTRWQVIRTSNAYCFRDPLPCATGCDPYKSENPAGTLNQEDSYTKGSMNIVVLDPACSWQSALIGLGRACGAIPAVPAA